jgi:hypothetical protein
VWAVASGQLYSRLIAVPNGWRQAARVPSDLNILLCRVLTDLQIPEPVSLAVGYANCGNDWSLWVQDVDSSVMTGISLAYPLDEVYTTVKLANSFQQVMLEADASWGEARPACLVDHSHPATATERERLAVWACPRSGEVVAKIGARYAR